jgi:serine/threonine protein kinase
MESAVNFLRTNTLADRLIRFGRLPWAEAVRIGAELADDLEHEHRLGVFGSAAPQSAGVTTIEDILYTAPEVLDGDAPDAVSDVYSLAATLHHLITGDPPFRPRTDDSYAACYIRVITSPAPRLPEPNPIELRELLHRALSKNPADRPATAAAFASALRALGVCLQGNPIPLRRRAHTDRLISMSSGSTIAPPE